MSGSGGGTNTVTSTQEFRPPSYITNSPQGNQWSNYLNNAQNLASQPYTPNPNPQTAPLNNTQLSGLNQAIDLGQNGSPSGNAAAQTSMGIMQNGGDNPYAGPNPYLDANINANADLMNRQYQQGTQATLNAQSARAGGFGSSAWQQMTNQGQAGLASAIGQMSNTARMQDYTHQGDMAQQGIQNQLQAANLGAGQLYQNDVNGARLTTGAGDALNAYQQQTLNDQNGAWNAQQQYPWQMLGNFGNALSQASGTSGTNTFTQQGQGGAPPWLSGLLGGGSLGLAAGNYFNWGQ